MKHFLEALTVVTVAAFAGYLLAAFWSEGGLAAGLLLSGALLMAYIHANRG
jgi:hypothetical protein